LFTTKPVGRPNAGKPRLPSIEVAIPTGKLEADRLNCKIRVHFRTNGGREIDPTPIKAATKIGCGIFLSKRIRRRACLRDAQQSAQGKRRSPLDEKDPTRAGTVSTVSSTKID